jgi:hypothetical protein
MGSLHRYAKITEKRRANETGYPLVTSPKTT